MSGILRSTNLRAVPERFGWTLRVLLAIAVLYAVVGVVTLSVQVAQLITWAQPNATVPVTMNTTFDLPTNTLHNSYSGMPFVQDGTAVTATQVTTTLHDVPFGNRLMMGIAPVLWTLTALLITFLLAVAIRRLLAGAAFGRDSSRPVVAAAATLAIGSSLAQIVQGVSDLGFGAFDWAASDPANATIYRSGGATFGFTPLFIACGLLAVALILRRGFALQRDVEGLV